MSAPFVDRMILEGDELAERVKKIANFLDSEEHGKLAVQDQILLNAQAGAMSAYLQILNLRIARAKGQVR